MNRSKALPLSLIIPAYNEERHIAACLDSVAAQTIPADEVIVVDNNSTDRTAEIASTYQFVKVVREPVQGLIAARNKGFAVAKGDLLARIDCDARLPVDWVARVKANLADGSFAAVTGLGKTSVIPFLSRPRTTWWLRAYFRDTTASFGLPILWGSNMAIRRTAWQKIKAKASADDRLVHEDQDLSVLLAAAQLPVKLDPHLFITTGGEQFAHLPKAAEYIHRRHKTLAHHRELGTLAAARAFAAMNPTTRWFTRFMLLPVDVLSMVMAVYGTIAQLIIHRRY